MNCQRLGTRIYNAYLKSHPIKLNGEHANASQNLFSMKNPYILESLPEKCINNLEMLENKSLKKVCKFLDNFNEDELPKALNKYSNMLTKGIDKKRNFCTAPLVSNGSVGAGLGTGAGHAYRDGSFIIVGEKSRMITDSGIKHVIVNDAYYNILDDLAAKFPDVNFVRADKAVQYFEKL